MKYPFFHFDIEQNTDEWNEMRLGKITASAASCLLVGKEDELSVGALTYALEKAAERITNESTKPFFTTVDTERGHEYEILARKKYEQDYYCSIEQVGFIQLNDYVGCSPDGILIKEKKGTEFKCFRSDNHLHYIDLLDKYSKGEIPIYSSKRGEKGLLDKAKWAQLQFSMMVSGYDSWSIGFYNPCNFDKKELVKIDIPRDEETINLLEKQVDMLINEIKRLVNLVK